MTEGVQFLFESWTVRVVVDADGTPWWIGRDVCRALGVANVSQALARLADDERDGVCVTDRLGRPQTATAVNEAGLYRLIFASRKPAAERFKRWVAHEVLPSLRRSGEYRMAPTAPPAGDLPPDTDHWLSMVREARRTYGRAAAARVWASSPLPDPMAGIASVCGELEYLCLDFIKEYCVVSGSNQDFLTAGRLRDAVRQYCLDTGVAYPGPRAISNAFLALVRSGGVPGVGAIKRSTTGYVGLRLAE